MPLSIYLPCQHQAFDSKRCRGCADVQSISLITIAATFALVATAAVAASVADDAPAVVGAACVALTVAVSAAEGVASRYETHCDCAAQAAER